MKNFLFDLYGTLLDIKTDEYRPEFWEGIARLLTGDKKLAKEVKADYERLCGCAAERIGAEGEIDLLKVFEKLLAEYKPQKYRPEKIYGAAEFAAAFRKESMFYCRPFDGIPQMLEGLKARGASLYLLSNAQACFTHNEIDGAGLRKYFDGVMLSSEAGYKKPSPLFFREAFRRFSLSADGCVYVGNDLHDDVGGAHSVGMKCAYVQSPQSGVYKNPPVPDFITDGVPALTECLFSLAEAD